MVVYVIVLMPSTRKRYQHLYNFAGDYIYSNNRASAKTHIVCEKMIIQLNRSSSKILSLVVVSFFVLFAAPLYRIFILDEREWIVPVLLPFIDIENDIGFYINLGNQLLYIPVGVLIIPGIELVTCVLKNTITATAAIIENELQEFSDSLEGKSRYSVDSEWRFGNIIVRIADYDRSFFCLDFIEIMLF